MDLQDRLDTTEVGSGTSRRDLLARAGLLAGVVHMAGVAGSRDPTGTTATAAAETFVRSGRAMVVRGVDWRLVRPGVPPGTLPPAGSVALPLGRLVGEDGSHLGMFESSLMPTSGQGAIFHQLVFEDGTISAVGPPTLSDATFAVIGGTGRFVGASGTYRIRQQPAPSGGTAQFTFDITAAGGRND